MIDKSGLSVSSDFISFYPSAMAQTDSKWLKTETSETNSIEDSDKLCLFFFNSSWKELNKSGFLEKINYNPKKFFFQHRSLEENVFNGRKNRFEEINRFRIGDITQHLISVDIEEVVWSGGYIV